MGQGTRCPALPGCYHGACRSVQAGPYGCARPPAVRVGRRRVDWPRRLAALTLADRDAYKQPAPPPDKAANVSDDADPIFQPNPFIQPGLAVRIMDLSGANGSEPVETVTGFLTLEHANAFARRYVRDSLERSRVAGLTPEEVMASWFAFGEDAEVAGAGEHAWTSATELADFAGNPVRDAEDRNWRALDPRRDADDAAEEEE